MPTWALGMRAPGPETNGRFDASSPVRSCRARCRSPTRARCRAWSAFLIALLVSPMLLLYRRHDPAPKTPSSSTTGSAAEDCPPSPEARSLREHWRSPTRHPSRPMTPTSPGHLVSSRRHRRRRPLWGDDRCGRRPFERVTHGPALTIARVRCARRRRKHDQVRAANRRLTLAAPLLCAVTWRLENCGARHSGRVLGTCPWLAIR